MKRIALVGVDAGDKAHGLSLSNVTISPQEKAAARRVVERHFRHDRDAANEILEACGITS